MSLGSILSFVFLYSMVALVNFCFILFCTCYLLFLYYAHNNKYIDRKDKIHDNILLSDFHIKFLFYQAVRSVHQFL